MLNLDKYSAENLERIKKVIEIVLDELELQEINHFAGNKIQLRRFEQEGLFYEQVITILAKIAKEEDNFFKIANEEIKRKVENSVPFYILDKDIKDYARQSYRKEFLENLQLTEADLRNNIILRLKDDQSIYRLKEILVLIERQTYVTFPTGKDYIYLNGILYLRTLNEPAPLDLSNAPILRPVFESFFYLCENTGKKLLDDTQLLKKYKQLTGEKIDWRLFIKRKASIVGKMINKKPELQSRIIWEYDTIKKMYKFEILPLLDK